MRKKSKLIMALISSIFLLVTITACGKKETIQTVDLNEYVKVMEEKEDGFVFLSRSSEHGERDLDVTKRLLEKYEQSTKYYNIQDNTEEQWDEYKNISENLEQRTDTLIFIKDKEILDEFKFTKHTSDIDEGKEKLENFIKEYSEMR